jgi:hypothetical protein
MKNGHQKGFVTTLLKGEYPKDFITMFLGLLMFGLVFGGAALIASPLKACQTIGALLCLIGGVWFIVSLGRGLQGPPL